MPSLHRFRPVSDDAMPPADIRFCEFRVEPWPDGHRIRVHLTITPFQQNPNIEVVLTNTDGQVLASTMIIETVEYRMVFTMHIRTPQSSGQYLLSASISYPELGNVDQQSIAFEISQSSGGDS